MSITRSLVHYFLKKIHYFQFLKRLCCNSGIHYFSNFQITPLDFESSWCGNGSLLKVIAFIDLGALVPSFNVMSSKHVFISPPWRSILRKRCQSWPSKQAHCFPGVRQHACGGSKSRHPNIVCCAVEFSIKILPWWSLSECHRVHGQSHHLFCDKIFCCSGICQFPWSRCNSKLKE